MILMADLTWKPIENIRIGEYVYGLNEINQVIDLYRPRLGDRQLMELPGNLVFSGEHLFWIKKPNGKQQFGTNDFNAYKREQRYSPIYIGLTKTEPYVITEPVEHAHLDGWKVAYRKVLYNLHDSNLQLYHLIVDGSHTYIANGYVVGGEVRDDDYDFSNIKWEDTLNVIKNAQRQNTSCCCY